MKKRLLLAGCFICIAGLGYAGGDESVSEPAGPQYANLRQVPIVAIHPEGWLRQYLVNQRDGLTGHLENAGYPFNTVGWVGERIPENHSIEDWWPYEQNAYWVDGMFRCGLLLNDDFLTGKARRSIDYVLNHPAANGYLGPKLDANTAEIGRWIHVVFFRSLMADYEATRDPRIPAAIKRHYLAGDYAYTGGRDVINIESILWTYGYTGDPALLRLAEESYQKFNDRERSSEVSDTSFLKDSPANEEHGVTYNETAKLGAILYLYTGNEAYLKPSIAAYRKIDKYHLLISGVNVSSEHLHPVTTTESCETCDISDYTWSAGYLLMATGDAAYADKIERAAFNAAPGGATGDFKALQYSTAPNQVICTHTSCVRTGGSQMSYSPNPGTECCPGNVNRMMPNFTSRLWMTDRRGGLAAVMYAPSQVVYNVGPDRKRVEIREVTEYPFSEEIRFEIKTGAGPVQFPFTVRIPGWCRAPRIAINGKAIETTTAPASFVRIEREFKDGDVVTLTLPQEVALEDGPEHTVSVVRGPLVYALKVEEDWRIDPADKRSTKDFPAYDLYPKSPWNYALCVDRARLNEQIKVMHRPYTDSPWTIASAPIELRAPARLVRNWAIHPVSEVLTEHWDVIRDPATGKVTRWVKSGFDKQTGNFLFTPPVPDANTVAENLETETTMVTLVPYGSSKLRITYFPRGEATP
jgi:uncharacterized protein